ncbi:hypothetical protein J6590_051577 [Homalodisca vitripennis]|nr:hypothetical protein J6590_051577 [Homalodisca vitripennis]
METKPRRQNCVLRATPRQRTADPYRSRLLTIRRHVARSGLTLDFESELEIAQAQILSMTEALFISTIDLVLYRLSPLFCFMRFSHRLVAHDDRQNKAEKEIGLSFL